MSLSRAEFEAQAEWLRSELRGARVQQVRVPDAERVVLGLRSPGVTHWVLLCAARGLGRVHTIPKPPPNPKQAQAFQGLLRKELRGAVDALTLLPGERILRLDVSGPGDGASRAMILEVFGGGGNLVLLDEADRVLGRSGPARNPGSRAGRGELWTPPGSGRAQPSRPSAEALPSDADIRTRFAALEVVRAREQALTDALRRLRQERKKLSRLLRRQQADRARAGDPDVLRTRADLLRGSFHLLERGRSTVRLVDWSAPGQPEVEVEVDPALEPAAQVERAYQRARRAARTKTEADARIRATTEQLADLAADEEALLAGDAMPGPGPRAKAPSGRAQRDTPRRPYRSWWTKRGIEIRVGRGARDNDDLTLRHSNGNDVWLHVRGRPGAHVVIRRPGKAPPSELLLLGAQLALVHSGLADGAREEVAWTRVKHVRKPKGLPPGKVLITQERVLFVETDRSTLDVLERRG